MKNIKLNKLAENRLNEKEMNSLNGGYVWGTKYNATDKVIYTCGCGCYYEGQPGGSTSNANANANADHGYQS